MPDISRYVFDEVLLQQATHESDFMEPAVELLKEACHYVTAAASILPYGRSGWERNQGILCGLMVRISKLLRAILDQTCQHRRETAFIFIRLAFEAIVNLRYLVKKNCQDLFESYVLYSLRTEKKLLERVRQDAAERGGNMLPFEVRIEGSVQRSFQAAGISIDEVDANDQRDWSFPDNIYKRTKEVGLQRAYLAAYSSPNHSVHGNFEDLYRYHLDRTSDGMFTPHIDWHEPRPQICLGIAIVCLEAVRDYWRYVDPSFPASVQEALDDLGERIRRARQLQEEFIQRSGIASTEEEE